MLRTLQLGFKSLLLHKLRSGLAMLGIMIGVTAVVWLVALGEGVSYEAQQQIKDLGATNIIVRSVKPPQTSSRMSGGFMVEYGLLRDDFERITSTIPSVTQAVPVRELRKEVRYNARLVDTRLVGTTPKYATMNHLRLARGRFLSDRDLAQVDNVAVLAATTAQTLFPFEDPIGKTVLVENDLYVVIGQTEDRTPSAAIGGSLAAQEYNLDIYIPISTLRARIGDSVITARSGSFEGEVVQLSQMTVTVADIEQVDETADIINALLARYHKYPDYAVTVPKELLRQAEVMQMLFNGLLLLIAGISLIVGGIGIMNIMLATVTERTREIGIRRALGAKQQDIIHQFLAETVVLSATGGLLGVFCGFLCGPALAGLRWATGVILPDVIASLPASFQTLEPRIAPWSVVSAFLISVCVGVIFGIYPARRAAMMDPIEALRNV